MTITLTYYVSLASPWTFLGHQRLVDLADRFGAKITVAPMSLADVFPVSGGLPLPKRAPQRQAYRLVELQRWSAHLGLDLTLHPKFFPVDDTKAAHAVIATGLAGLDAVRATGALLSGVWQQDRNIADDDDIALLLDQVGLPGGEIASRINDPDVIDGRAKATRMAIDAQVFGAPTYQLGEELFWGQDRLMFLEQALDRL